jgi:glucose-6-phosphate dehydrogenase assembly protein OpcA
VAQDVAPIQRLEERPIGVDAHAIEEEFDRIWRETAEMQAGSEGATIRLRVLNLVALARTASDADRFEQVMQALPQRQPCRGMLAFVTPSIPQLEASISAHCWRAGNESHVCSEEIMLHGAPAHEPEMASAMLALLVPEIPVVFWMVSPPTHPSYLEEELLEAADRVFFDSAAIRDVHAGLAAGGTITHAHDVVACDLAWARLETWRLLTAQMFDGEDGPRELAQVTSIQIDGDPASTETLLLAGWLMSRLGLSPADARSTPDRLEATLYRGVAGVTLTIAGTAGSGMTKLTLRTADASFAVEHHAQSRHMHLIEHWEGGSSRHAVEPQPIDDGAVMTMAMDAPLADGRVYTQAVDAALGLLPSA